MQDITPLPKHEGKIQFISIEWKLLFDNLDCHFTAASIKHIKDLAGIFGNDCVFYLTQDTKAKVSIGQPSTKGQSPLIMHLDYEMSSTEPQANSIVTHHQLKPW